MNDAQAWLPSALAFVGAFLLVLAGTPVVRRLAIGLDFVDRPDGGRKAHERETALGGGVVVLAGFLTGLGVAYVVAGAPLSELFADGFGVLAGDGGMLRGISWIPALLSLVLLCGIGLLDDRLQLRGRYKLAGQIVAALLMISSGVVIREIELFGFHLGLGYAAVPFTLFWLLGAINALNLLDGADGLASSVGLVLCVAGGVIAASSGNYLVAIVAAALGGSLLGFLRYNFAPASIFLGDAGSMLVGLAVGALTVLSATKTAVVGLVVPVAVLSVPILDSTAAILRRKLMKRSLFSTDRGHLHHALLRRGWGVERTVLFITLLSALTSGGALVGVFLSSDWIPLLVTMAVVLALAGTRLFGDNEATLLLSAAKTFLKSLAYRSTVTGDDRVFEHSVRPQGGSSWDDVWREATALAVQETLVRMELTVDRTEVNEVFFGTWKRSIRESDQERVWSLELPIRVDGKPVGRLHAEGLSGGRQDEKIERLLTLKAEIESTFAPTPEHESRGVVVDFVGLRGASAS